MFGRTRTPVAFRRTRANKTSLNDFTVRDLAGERRQAFEKKGEVQQPRRREQSIDDWAIEYNARRAQRAAEEEERAQKIELTKRSRGRGM
jgi:hypothetical protein